MAHEEHVTETPDTSYIKNVDVTHEVSDVYIGGIAKFVVALTVLMIVSFVLMWALFRSLESQATDPRRAPMAEERLPPEPRLQAAPGFQIKLENGQTVNLEKAAPQTEYRVLRLQWEENLKTGLKDQSGNVVGMPIDAAIDKVVSDGLRSTVKEPGKKLSDFAIEMPTASSSGRTVEKRLQ